jgi:rod shape-determining protein MreC
MNSRNFIGTFVVTLLVIVLLIFNQIFSLGLGNKITNLTSPVGVVISSTGQRIGNFFGGIIHIGSLQKENNELKNQLDAALFEIAQLSEAKKENAALRADLGFKEMSSLDLVPAEIAYFDASLNDGITVRVGNVEGINPGNVVLSQGYLIGRVTEVRGNNVKILLITDSTSSIPITIQTKSITGIARGKIGSGLTIEQVPQSDNLVKGDIVITSGLGGDIPKGLILGQVEKVEKVSGSIFQYVTVLPGIELTRIERVMIVR